MKSWILVSALVWHLTASQNLNISGFDVGEEMLLQWDFRSIEGMVLPWSIILVSHGKGFYYDVAMQIPETGYGFWHMPGEVQMVNDVASEEFYLSANDSAIPDNRIENNPDTAFKAMTVWIIPDLSAELEFSSVDLPTTTPTSVPAFPSATTIVGLPVSVEASELTLTSTVKATLTTTTSATTTASRSSSTTLGAGSPSALLGTTASSTSIAEPEPSSGFEELDDSPHTTALSPAATVGIVIGSAAGATVLIAIGLLLRKRRRARAALRPRLSESSDQSSLGDPPWATTQEEDEKSGSSISSPFSRSGSWRTFVARLSPQDTAKPGECAATSTIAPVVGAEELITLCHDAVPVPRRSTWYRDGQAVHELSTEGGVMPPRSYLGIS